MSIATVTTAGETVPLTGAGRHEVVSPVGTLPLRVFRQTLVLRFLTGGIADGIRIDPDSTYLKGTFSPFDYDALHQEEPALKAQLGGSGGTVIVALDAPRQVSGIRLSPGKASGTGNAVELYRLDGDTLAEKPTSSAGVQNNAAVFPESAGFTDARFAVRLAGSTAPSLGSSDLAAVQLRSRFAGARVGISDPDDPGSATFFWPTPEDVSRTPPARLTDLDASRALAAALGRHLDEVFAGLQSADKNEPLPESIDVALIVESDAPCVLDLAALDVAYHQVTKTFYSGNGENSKKQVLRFPGGRGVAREVLVRLPSGANLISAGLETVESFSKDRPLASDEKPPNVPPTQDKGVHVGSGRWAAQAIVPPRATFVSGVTVALLALARDTQVLVELQEDSDGRPSGKKLASASLPLDRAFRRYRVSLLFPEVITLFSKPYWLLLGTAAGRAVWLANSDDGGLKVLDRTADGQSEFKALDGLVATQELIVRGGQTQDQQPGTLTVGENVVEGTSGQDGLRTYDLSSAIDSYLESSANADPATTIPLTLTSAFRGTVTVYAPGIEYDLP